MVLIKHAWVTVVTVCSVENVRIVVGGVLIRVKAHTTLDAREQG